MGGPGGNGGTGGTTLGKITIFCGIGCAMDINRLG
jgi:hypothetical protein